MRFSAALLLLALAAPSVSPAAQPWNVLVLVYAQTTDAKCVIAGNVSTEYIANASLDAAQIDTVLAAVDNFEQIASRWSGGLGAVSITVERPTRAISSATEFDGECWLAPDDAAQELDKYAAKGDYDSVIALWHKGIMPGPLGAAALDPVTWQGKTFTWSTVHIREAFFPAPDEIGPNFKDPGEAILHEWLHPVGQFYRSLGYSVPDSDDSDDYPFPSDNPGGVGGFEKFYTQLLRGRLVDSLGKYTGISPAVWDAGSLRAGSGVEPKPLQLIAPPEVPCQPTDAALEWTGPWPAQTIFEVRLDDDQGGFINHQTNQTQVELADLPLQTGRSYRWKVRTLAAPAGSEADRLSFRATGPGPNPPIFLPDGGQLDSGGSPVFIRADPGLEVRYTVNGADPQSGDPLVPPTGEVEVQPPAQLKARAFAANCAPSSVKSALYGIADILTVTSTDDAPIGPPDAGTLRWAIIEANLAPGRQVIAFAIPGDGVHTIDLGLPLPVVTDPVLIDGWSQPGFLGSPLIEIDGALGGSGLTLAGGASIVRGLVINNSGAHGIRIDLLGANTIRGCYIGTNAAGNAARANLGHGIYITDSDFNLIGGPDPFEGNLISGNLQRGIQIAGPFADENTVVGNRIGTNLAGTNRIPNGVGGIELDNSAANQIGGSLPGWGNLISGNGFSGDPNAGDGLGIAGPQATGNIVEGNLIGTDVNGTADLGNSRAGLLITELAHRTGPSASGNRIGGTEPGAGNVISGNDAEGLGIVAVGGGATDNVVQGNFIGTDASGSFDLGNALSGIVITRRSAGEETASRNLIGGTEPGARNVISGNNLDGVGIVGSSSEGNSVLGNYIGVDAQGRFDVGNSRSGVRLTATPALGNAATFNRIGGPSWAERNVISGNDQSGIAILGSPGGGGSNWIQGNLIGLGADGSASLGNGVDGILVTSNLLGGFTLINTIGGLSPGERNVIGRNGGAGVRLEGAGTDTNFVEGNLIGIDVRGNPQPNSGDGVFVSGPNNVVAGNRIARNSGAGVVVSAANENRVGTNSISDNGQLGIDLIDGNELQPAPLIAAVTTSSGTLIRGSLSAEPETEYTLEFFSSPSCDPSGSGEGLTPLGRTWRTTDAAGNLIFQTLTPEPVPLGLIVTATATELLEDNTSEFSACAIAQSGPPSDPDGDQNPGGGDNCPGVPNPGQEDTGGLNTALPNGRGNACECGDVTDNGVVDAADVGLFRAHLVDRGVEFQGAILGKCSVFGTSPSLCDSVDVVVLRRALASQAPGLGSSCALP
jgi:parallel beta-helix repeat protein